MACSAYVCLGTYGFTLESLLIPLNAYPGCGRFMTTRICHTRKPLGNQGETHSPPQSNVSMERTETPRNAFNYVL